MTYTVSSGILNPTHSLTHLLTNTGSLAHIRPIEKGVGVCYLKPCNVWGASPSLRNIKYTRMHHFKKKNSKIFSPEGPHENVTLGRAVALDVPGTHYQYNSNFTFRFFLKISKQT